MFTYRFYSNLGSNCFTLEKRNGSDWEHVANVPSLRDVWGLILNMAR